MEITQLKLKIKFDLLDLRAIYYYVQKEDFLNAYDLASDTQKEEIVRSIDGINPIELKRICNGILCKKLEQKPIRHLHIMASKLGIVNYKYYRKNELISAIKEKQDEKERND